MTESRRGTKSVWMNVPRGAPLHPLDHSLEKDVCIVGAGMAGLSTAYCLSCEGKSVVVLDDGPIGGGMTERTTAHLSNVIDDGYATIERLHGEEGARMAADSHTSAINRIESIVSTEHIACDFERVAGFLFQAPGQEEEELEQERLAALRAGLVGVERIERPSGPRAGTGSLSSISSSSAISSIKVPGRSCAGD